MTDVQYLQSRPSSPGGGGSSSRRAGASWRRSPLPRGWERIRAQVLARDGYRCTFVGSDGVRCPSSKSNPIGGRLEVDHVGDRDDHSLANLRTLCAYCHAQRTAQQAAEARRQAGVGYRPRARQPERHPGLIDPAP